MEDAPNDKPAAADARHSPVQSLRGNCRARSFYKSPRTNQPFKDNPIKNARDHSRLLAETMALQPPLGHANWGTTEGLF